MGKADALSHAEILKLHAAVVSSGLAVNRAELLEGIDGSLVSGIRQSASPTAQILTDLSALNTADMADGSVPILRWLQNAVAFAGGKREAAVFAQALARLGGGVEPAPTPPREQPREATPVPADGIRILFLGANPDGTTQLRLDREVREITQRLRASAHRDRFEVVQEWALRRSDLQAALMQHEPTIVHFGGHGGAGSGADVAAGARGGIRRPAHVTPALMVEDETGKAVPVPPAALAKLFKIFKQTIRCVVLNACYSAEQAAAISEHIDCVVGMTDAIQDRAAIAFAGSFYQALGFGKSVQMAFDLGSNEIDLTGLGQADVPQLSAREGVRPDGVYLARAGARAGG